MRMGVTCGVIAFAVAMLPRIAEACSFPCGLVIERPMTGEAHPANAALRIAACSDFVETMLTVTVDGVPANLGQAVAVPGFLIWPRPSPGQEVVIMQCGEDAPTFGCPDPAEPFEVLRYVAGPDDTEAAPAAGAVTISHTYGPTEVACMEEGDVEFHIDVTGLDQGSETDVLYVVVLETGLPEGYSDSRRAEWVGPAAVTSLSFDIGEHLDLATIPPEDACVTVTAVDLAGHLTTIAETCGSTPTNAPPSTGDDSSGGGVDDSGDGDDAASTTGGEPPIDTSTAGIEPADTGDVDLDDDLGDRGCACAVDRESAPGLLGLVTLVMFARRRRRSSAGP